MNKAVSKYIAYANAQACGKDTMNTAFEQRIGIVGHPTTPDVAWSDAQLGALRDLGLNTLQLSIAWAWRPANEVLNLENLDEPHHRETFHFRIQQARKFGFRTLGHFGLPMGPQNDATTCILDPAVRENYAQRLHHFMRDFDADDVMIYTYDQQAWLCSEFGDCPRCHGLPLHERLVPFLEMLVDAVRAAKPSARLWWEPWELSEGQILMCAQHIKPDNFGLIMHHTLAEVYFINTTDLAFRNVARVAAQRGIPLVGEGFFGGAGEDIDPLTHLACPRLVHQQLQALHTTVGVTGVKEYYGLVPAHFSVNAAIFKAYLHAPETSLDDVLNAAAAPYGDKARSALLAAWETTAQAMELFPWNASWRLRRIFASSLDEAWPDVPRASWATPAWQANRRGFYMVTDDARQHPWLLEDVGLRAHLAAHQFQRAAQLLADAQAAASSNQIDIGYQQREVERAARVAAHLGAEWLAHRAEQQRHDS